MMYLVLNKLQTQMRQNSRLALYCQPIKSPDIDRSHSKPLRQTVAPMAQIISQTSPLKLNIGVSCKNHRGYSQSDRTNINYDQGSVQLWRNKYEYVKKDNELLQSQIIYMNEHINHLAALRKKQQGEFMVKLGDVSKIFMQQLVGCQQGIRDSLELLYKKQDQLISIVDEIKQKLKNRQFCLKFKQKKIDQVYNYEYQELFRIKIQNTKLTTRIKILQEEIKDLGTKYVSNYQWKNYSFNIVHQLENRMLDRVFSSLTKSESLGLTSHSSHCLDKQTQKRGYLE